MYNALTGQEMPKVGAVRVEERSHVEELQRAIGAVKTLVGEIHRLRDSLSGNEGPANSISEKPIQAPCLLDQLIQTPTEIQQLCEDGYKCLDTLRGYLRLR